MLESGLSQDNSLLIMLKRGQKLAFVRRKRELFSVWHVYCDFWFHANMSCFWSAGWLGLWHNNFSNLSTMIFSVGWVCRRDAKTGDATNKVSDHSGSASAQRSSTEINLCSSKMVSNHLCHMSAAAESSEVALSTHFFFGKLCFSSYFECVPLCERRQLHSTRCSCFIIMWVPKKSCWSSAQDLRWCQRNSYHSNWTFRTSNSRVFSLCYFSGSLTCYKACARVWHQAWCLVFLFPLEFPWFDWITVSHSL